MDKVAQIGGTRIATPPGNNRAAVSLDNAARYYVEALEMGRSMGVQPLLELWGTHPVLGPLKNGIYVTVAAGQPDASLLLDVFHIYKSGTPFTSLKQINGGALHVIHINDYPQAADPSTLNDGNRVYPGDGWRRSGRSCATCATTASAAASRSSCSTRSTGPGTPTTT